MKEQNKPSYRALKIGGIALASAGLVAATIASGIGYSVQKDKVENLSNELANVNADFNIALTDLNLSQETNADLTEALAALGLKAEKFENSSLDKDSVIIDLKKVIAEMNDTIEAIEPVIVFQGYDKEFGLGEDVALTLTDNQLEILGDYEVDVDGEDISVEESLKVNAYFNKEDSLSLMFDEESVQYIINYDKEANISEDDSMKINLFGEEVEVIGIEDGKLTIKIMDDKFVKAGESLNGVEVLKISEDAILVQVGEDMELLDEGSHEINDIKIEVGAILYIEGDSENLVNLKVGEELEKIFETTGDDKFYDEAEMWKFTTIEEGKIVISLGEDVEEVDSLMLPNDYAKISFNVDDVDYNKVKVEKEDGVITKVDFELENFDSTYVELKDGVWEPEDDEEVIDFESGVELKDSDYSVMIENGKVFIINSADERLVKVFTDKVIVDGDSDFDNDENIISVDGIVVEPTEDYTDEEDETLNIEVPEETVKVTVVVE